MKIYICIQKFKNHVIKTVFVKRDDWKFLVENKTYKKYDFYKLKDAYIDSNEVNLLETLSKQPFTFVETPVKEPEFAEETVEEAIENVVQERKPETKKLYTFIHQLSMDEQCRKVADIQFGKTFDKEIIDAMNMQYKINTVVYTAGYRNTEVLVDIINVASDATYESLGIKNPFTKDIWSMWLKYLYSV